MDASYYSGTSGILLPYKNKNFYPESFQGKSRLTVCSLLFNSLEVNSSFYKIPRLETVQRWSEEVTAGFRFTFKLWRGITHNKGLIFDPQDVDRFLNVITAVGDTKGCLLVQLPPSISFHHRAQVDLLLKTIMKNDQSKGWRVCVEFRHTSWYKEETLQLLDGYGIASVIHDKHGQGIQVQDMETPFVYVRFHGPEGNYKGSYEDSFLQEYSFYIKDWLDEGKEVYVYFNNTVGAALDNLITLSAYVEERN